MLGLVLSACDRGNHPSQPGHIAPDFVVSDGASRIHLADYRGKVVLVNFWASWCEPCVLELPSLEQLHHRHPEIAILAVSIDDDADAYKQFLVDHHVDMTTVRDPGQTAASKFHSDMWPETYAIDRQGIIRRKFVGATDWNSPEVNDYLKLLEH